LAPLYFGYPPPPYPYYPAPFVTQVAPPVYIEQYPVQQPQAQMASAPPSSWYFCQSSSNYYPYVQECPEGWQLVSPQPLP
jgi:hypothetical protein